MSAEEPGTITRAINKRSSPEESRAAFDAIYGELRSRARGLLSREYGDRTIQPTVLVHEAYMKLMGNQEMTWESRAHFFGAAARAMRQILVDEARKRRRPKNNGGKRALPLQEEKIADRSSWGSGASHHPINWVALDRALAELEVQDPRMAQVVALRFFAGLDNPAIARALNVTTRTIERDWNHARAWLRRRMGEDEGLDI